MASERNNGILIGGKRPEYVHSAQGTGLRRILGLPALVFFGLVYMVPLTMFTTYGVVTEITGGRTASAYLITLAAMLFTAFSYSFMVKKYPIAGSAYSYTSLSFGPCVGFLAGWSLLLDYLFLPMINYLLIGLFLNIAFPMVPAWPFLLQGAMYTVLFAAVSMVLGLILGFSVAVVRVTKVPVVSQIAAVYVSAFRGTPLLVQIFVLYYGLPSVGIEFTPVTAGILALTLNVAAYLSESMRGAILGIDKGQWEAGLSVGLTWGQTLWNIITPQALRLAVPSLSNSLISLIKDTSLISVITVTELMLATKEVIAETFQPLPLYLAAAGIYWLLSALFERVQKALENRLTAPLRR